VLRACHGLEPFKVPGSQLAEGDAAPTLLDIALDLRLLGVGVVNPGVGRNVWPGNGPGNCRFGQRSRVPSWPGTPDLRPIRTSESPEIPELDVPLRPCLAAGRGFESRRSRFTKPCKTPSLEAAQTGQNSPGA
jgi:hypothetical protein